MNLKRLILEGENTTVDFKKTISSAEKIAKTLVAFANNQGGRLLIGITDDGNIKGVKSEDEEKYMITKAAHQFCRPAIEPRFEEVYIDEKIVVVAEIPKSDIKPHYALDENQKWWVYYRIKDKSVLASKIIVDVLKEANKETGPLIVYSDQEKILLKYLEEKGRITLREYCKMTKGSIKKAQKVLVNLILAGVILPHTSEKEEYFTAVEIK